MNEIQSLLDTQESFQNELGIDFRSMDEKDIAKYIKDQIYWSTEELHEMGREIPHIKDWKDYSSLSPIEKLEMSNRAREEYIDLIHFVANIGIALGLTGKQIMEMYYKKHKINQERQTNPDLGYIKGEK